MKSPLFSLRGVGVLCCSRRNSSSPQRSACCARGKVLFYRSLGRRWNPHIRCARPHRCAWLSCARKRVMCIVVGGDPRSRCLFLSFLPSLSLSLLFAQFSSLRDIHKAPHHAALLKKTTACYVSRLRRLESSRNALLFWGAWHPQQATGTWS